VAMMSKIVWSWTEGSKAGGITTQWIKLKKASRHIGPIEMICYIYIKDSIEGEQL
jgi:hypothetical protein